ncbi:hypothetical protein BDZ97DRAFT_1101640 [Flammula alnicola]|nr:hypothetical protein BDZ97DRAFT_1101640 [Flammula alnicola]
MKSNTISLKQRLFTLSLHRTLSPNYNDDFTSPVPHLLNSNAVPTDSERRLIQDAVDRVSVLTGDILEALHGGIASERETGFKLDGGKPRLEAGLEFLRVHKAILSPVRQLPAEILAEIISINAESFLLNPHPRLVLDSSNPVNFPWSPSQVSRFWRETTLSLHHLWGQLIIDACLLKGKKPSKAFLKFFTLCLERSQDAPLHIYLCSPTRQPEDLTPFLDLLMAHAERWQTLYLLTKPSFLNALEGVRDRLSSLTRFDSEA